MPGEATLAMAQIKAIMGISRGVPFLKGVHVPGGGKEMRCFPKQGLLLGIGIPGSISLSSLGVGSSEHVIRKSSIFLRVGITLQTC